MNTNKMFERINGYRKDYIHEQYTRIVENFKNYEKITKKQMITSIYKVYSNYKNIIDICTTRELEFIILVLDKKSNMDELLSDNYNWERVNLRNKFLIIDDYDKVSIPDEIEGVITEAIKNVDLKITKRMDDLNEILVSYCKIQASSLLHTVCTFASGIVGMNEEYIWNHMLTSKLFNYYVLIYPKNIEGLGEDIPVALYHDYYSIDEQLDEERKKQGLSGIMPIDKKRLRTLFYNDFDINNKKIKKFLDEIQKLPFFWEHSLLLIREYAVLNIDRTPLKEAIKNVPSLKDNNLKDFFKVLDAAMDEMPSGALNGFTPNQAKEQIAEKEMIKLKKTANYIKQENACLSKKDAKLFYKIYFGLLEFTNKKYKINNNLKIYNTLGINPYDLEDIIEKFWNYKDAIVSEFCLANPFRFNEEEKKLANEFKKGFRDIIIIIKYEKEYTAVMNREKTYMIKGINDNIDNVISYQNLPQTVITSIIPFKNVLIYDGLLMHLGVDGGNNFEKLVLEEYSKAIKYYHI